MIYDNGQLDKVSTENGYIDFSGASPLYHDYLSGHLCITGRCRTQVARVGQVNQDYPFGELMAGNGTGELMRLRILSIRKATPTGCRPSMPGKYPDGVRFAEYPEAGKC